MLNCPACSPDLSPIKNIWCIIKCKIRQRRPWTLQQLETYQPRMGPISRNLNVQMPSNCLEKMRCSTMVNMHLSNYFETCHSIKFDMSSICAWNCKISQFKHLFCYLGSVVNEVLTHVIWKTFSFHFIQIYKTPQLFQNLGCQMILMMTMTTVIIINMQEQINC